MTQKTGNTGMQINQPLAETEIDRPRNVHSAINHLKSLVERTEDIKIKANEIRHQFSNEDESQSANVREASDGTIVSELANLCEDLEKNIEGIEYLLRRTNNAINGTEQFDCDQNSIGHYGH